MKFYIGNGKYFTGHKMCFNCHKKLKEGEAVVIFYVPYCKECAKKYGKRGVPFEEIWRW